MYIKNYANNSVRLAHCFWLTEVRFWARSAFNLLAVCLITSTRSSTGTSHMGTALEPDNEMLIFYIIKIVLYVASAFLVYCII